MTIKDFESVGIIDDTAFKGTFMEWLLGDLVTLSSN